MSRMDDLIQAATYRFRPDLELQAEIARELRAHLEDAFQAARAEGKDEAQAEEAAVRAFGDPEEIGKKLWEANFRRMRLRAVAKWSGRLVFMPAAILFATLLCWEALGFFGLLVFWPEAEKGDVGRMLGIYEVMPAQLSYRKDLTPDEAAARNVLQQPSRSEYEEAQRLVARFPENRIFRAHMAIWYMHDKIEGPDRQPLSAATVAEALGLFDECERADPQNAFYNYLKADVLMFLSGAAEGEEYTYSEPNPTGKVRERYGYRLILADRGLFQKGLDEYRKGLGKPYCDAYVTPYTEYYLGLRQIPGTLLGEIWQIAVAEGEILPHLSMLRTLTHDVVAYASLLIQEGKKDEATNLLRAAPIPGTQLGARGSTILELLVARAMRRTALLQGAVLFDKMGMSQMAEEARRIGLRESGRYGVGEGPSPGELDAVGEKLHKQAGMLAEILLWGDYLLPRATLADGAVLRSAERLNLERAALGVLAVFFLFPIAWLGTQTLVSMWRRRGEPAGPKLFFIGWMRLGCVILFAVIAPIAVYALLTRLPFGSAQYGINYDLDRVVLEMTATVLTILYLSVFLGVRAVRSRAREAGLAVPPRRFSRFIGILALISWGLWLLAAALYFCHWDSMRGEGYVLVAGLGFMALLPVVAAALRRVAPDEREFRASERRSLLPVLVACVIVIGAFARTYLFAAERAQIHKLQQPGLRLFIDELKYSRWSDYQDYLRRLPGNGGLQLPK